LDRFKGAVKYSLEREFRAQLQNARWIGGGNFSRIGLVDISARILKLSVIEDVKELKMA
jgi:hypothetical protein